MHSLKHFVITLAAVVTIKGGKETVLKSPSRGAVLFLLLLNAFKILKSKEEQVERL